MLKGGHWIVDVVGSCKEVTAGSLRGWQIYEAESSHRIYRLLHINVLLRHRYVIVQDEEMILTYIHYTTMFFWSPRRGICHCKCSPMREFAPE